MFFNFVLFRFQFAIDWKTQKTHTDRQRIRQTNQWANENKWSGETITFELADSTKVNRKSTQHSPYNNIHIATKALMTSETIEITENWFYLKPNSAKFFIEVCVLVLCTTTWLQNLSIKLDYDWIYQQKQPQKLLFTRVYCRASFN